MTKRIAAFTLVELLVVIGIIALLVSVLLPALNGARQQAVNVQCLSNLSSCGNFLYMYANQNKGMFPQMYLSVTEELPRNKMEITTNHNGVTFYYPDVKNELARLANPGSDPYSYLTTGKPFDAGGLKVFYCPGNWFWSSDIPATNSHKPEDFMKDAGTGEGGITGMITYWYFGDPDPYYPKYHYTGAFNTSSGTTASPLGEPATLAMNNTLDSYFFDTKQSGDNRDEYVVHLGERNMDGKALMTDQSRQAGSGNLGSTVGFQMVHGSQTNGLRKGWTNVLFADGHAESRKPNLSSFDGLGNWINPHPSPNEVQPRWENAAGKYEMW